MRFTVFILAVVSALAENNLSREMLAAHNDVRRRYGSAPLIWSEILAKVAQKWADSLLAGGRFQHSRNPAFGENLFEITGARATPSEVVEAWASEAADYNRAANSCRGQCGHYTQIVWGATQAVGCAVARGRGREVWVCNYDPPGNYVGRRP